MSFFLLFFQCSSLLLLSFQLVLAFAFVHRFKFNFCPFLMEGIKTTIYVPYPSKLIWCWFGNFFPNGNDMCIPIWVVGRERNKWTFGKYLKKITWPFFLRSFFICLLIYIGHILDFVCG
jgi:hypothetical protein